MRKVILKNLTKDDIGRRVIYKPFNEEGIVKSWNDIYVFVVYPGNNDAKKEHWDRYTAAATKPEDIFFLS